MCEIVIVRGVLIANNDVFISLERLASVNVFKLPVKKQKCYIKIFELFLVYTTSFWIENLTITKVL